MKKNLFLFLFLFFGFIPFEASALNGTVRISCPKEMLDPNESMTCTINANISEEVSTVSAKLEVNENLTLSNIVTDSIWEGDGEDGRIELYTDVNKIGSFPIAKFVVTGGTESRLSSRISLNNVILSDAKFEETKFIVTPVSVMIGKPKSDINTLDTLTIDGVSVPNFDSNLLHYEFFLEPDTKEVEIDATKTDSKSSIAGDLGKKELRYGKNQFQIEVTSESLKKKVYTITIYRMDARMLNTLKVNDIEVELKENVYEYDVTVKNDIESVLLSMELKYPTLAEFVLGYGPREISNLKVGENTITIKVADMDSNEQTYVIHVKRLSLEELPDNPNTGSSRSYLIILGIVLVSLCGMFFLKKKNYFKQI